MLELKPFAEQHQRSHPHWTWCGSLYPKTKRSLGPSQEHLAERAEFLKALFRMAPNGFPDGYRLRDALMKLDEEYEIFAHLAADRSLIMCKHCLMLYRSQQPILFAPLREVLALLSVAAQPPLARISSQELHGTDTESAESATLIEPAESATVIETCAQSKPEDTGDMARPTQLVPYCADGTID